MLFTTIIGYEAANSHINQLTIMIDMFNYLNLSMSFKELADWLGMTYIYIFFIYNKTRL